MEHKKDIGKAIKEKLEALDKAPGDHLWAAIEADLPKKKKRRMLPFWITFFSVVVIGLLIWSLAGLPVSERRNPGNVIDNELYPGHYDNENAANESDGGPNQDNDDTYDNQDTDANRQGQSTGTGTVQHNLDYGAGNGSHATSTGGRANETDAEASTHGRRAGNKTKRAAAATASRAAHESKTGYKKRKKIKNSKSSAATGMTGSSASGSNAESQSSAATVSDGTHNEQAATATGKPPAEQTKPVNDSVAKKLAEEKKKKREKPKDSLAKQELEQETFKSLRIFGYVAPTLYNTLANKSAIDKRLDSLPRKAEITFSYGGYVCFDYSQKLAIRLGIAKTSFKQRTQGIQVSSLDQQNYYNVDYNNISNLDLQQLFADSERFDIVQELSYTEFPIEVKYKFTDNAIGVEGIVGGSANLLSANTVTAESDLNQVVVLGSAKNQYKAYFSANLGVGLYWRFANNFRLNVEPMFKYHFRNADTALQPYSIAVLGGLEYTFNWKRKKETEKK